MNPLSWILVAWVVVAVASALKFWRMTAVYRHKPMQPGAALQSQVFREQLERLWEKDSRV